MLKAAKKRLAPFIGADNARGSPLAASQMQRREKESRGRDNESGDHHVRVRLRKGDLQALPIDDASVDAALLLLVLTYVPDPEIVIREMSRILKPAGRAIIVDLLPHDRDDFRRQLGQLHAGFSETTMKRLLESAGFESPTITGLPPEPNAKGPALFLASAIKS
jgi:ArsR family transcriptional regulator